MPVLLVPGDTYAAALQIERIDAELSAEDGGKIDLLEKLIADHVRLEAIDQLLSRSRGDCHPKSQV